MVLNNMMVVNDELERMVEAVVSFFLGWYGCSSHSLF